MNGYSGFIKWLLSFGSILPTVWPLIQDALQDFADGISKMKQVFDKVGAPTGNIGSLALAELTPEEQLLENQLVERLSFSEKENFVDLETLRQLFLLLQSTGVIDMLIRRFRKG